MQSDSAYIPTPLLPKPSFPFRPQHHLENLAFASLSEEDLAAHSDQAVVKAFRLAQLTIEYLLHVQVMLDLACVCVSGLLTHTPPTTHQRHTNTNAKHAGFAGGAAGPGGRAVRVRGAAGGTAQEQPEQGKDGGDDAFPNRPPVGMHTPDRTNIPTSSTTHQRDEALALLKKQLRQQQRRGAAPFVMGTDEAGGQTNAAAAAAAAMAAAAAAATAAAGTVPRSSKLRLYVTLPDGACAGVLASPLMLVSRAWRFRVLHPHWDDRPFCLTVSFDGITKTQIHELKRQVLPDLLSAISATDTHLGPGSTALRFVPTCPCMHDNAH